jgi:hypothetical protein
MSVVPDTFAPQDPKHLFKCPARKEHFDLFLLEVHRKIVPLALQVTIVLRRQYLPRNAPSATFVPLLPTSLLPAPLGRSEMLPCLQIQMIACHAIQDFIATEVLHPCQQEGVFLDTFVLEAHLLRLPPCSHVLKEAFAPQVLISPSLVHPAPSTTRLNLAVLLSASLVLLVCFAKDLV